MEIRRMKLSDLTPAEYNPRVDLTPDDKELQDLKISLGEHGLVQPIVFNEALGRVVSGHQRIKALQLIGETEADVHIVRLTETKEKEAVVALNQLDGEWDYDRLEDIFEELDLEDVYNLGFSKEELAAHSIFPEGEEEEDGGAIYGDEENEEDEDQGDGSDEFTVFLSFPTKVAAERWKDEEGIEGEFSPGRTLIVRMGGKNNGNQDS